MSRISDDELQRYCLTSCSSGEIANKGGMFVHRVALDCRDARAGIARLTEENGRLVRELEQMTVARDFWQAGSQLLEARQSRAEARLAAATTVTDEDVEVALLAPWKIKINETDEGFSRKRVRAALTAFVAFKQAGAGEGENQEGGDATSSLSTTVPRASTPAPQSDACGADMLDINEIRARLERDESCLLPYWQLKEWMLAILTNPLVVAARKGGGL